MKSLWEKQQPRKELVEAGDKGTGGEEQPPSKVGTAGERFTQRAGIHPNKRGFSSIKILPGKLMKTRDHPSLLPLFSDHPVLGIFWGGSGSETRADFNPSSALIF